MPLSRLKPPSRWQAVPAFALPHVWGACLAVFAGVLAFQPGSQQWLSLPLFCYLVGYTLGRLWLSMRRREQDQLRAGERLQLPAWQHLAQGRTNVAPTLTPEARARYLQVLDTVEPMVLQPVSAQSLPLQAHLQRQAQLLLSTQLYDTVGPYLALPRKTPEAQALLEQQLTLLEERAQLLSEQWHTQLLHPMHVQREVLVDQLEQQRTLQQR